MVMGSLCKWQQWESGAHGLAYLTAQVHNITCSFITTSGQSLSAKVLTSVFLAG
jgi:hypothetical protein